MTGGLHAGLYHFAVAYSGDPNFESSDLSWDVRVTPAPLTVTATSFDIDHGDPIPTLTYKITGLVNNDAPAGLQRLAKAQSTKVNPNIPGHYPIDIAIGTLADPDYKIQLVPGMLTVHPKVLDVRVEWGSRSMSILGLNRDLPFAGIKVIDAVFSDDELPRSMR